MSKKGEYRNLSEVADSRLKAAVIAAKKLCVTVAEDQSEERLSEIAWWWRYVGRKNENSRRVLQTNFDQDQEAQEWLPIVMKRCQWKAAMFYETVLREFASDLSITPWLRLPNDLRIEFINLVPLDDPTAFGIQGTDSRFQWKSKPYFTRRCEYEFNLLHSDKFLADLFLEFFIRPERQARGFPNPQPNKHKRNRGISWKPLEFFDLMRFEVRKLNDSERSQLSKFRKKQLDLLNGYTEMF